MTSGREAAHVRAGLGDDHVGDADADPGDRDHQVPGAAKGLDHHLDPGGELGDGAAVLVDHVQVQPGQESVVLGESAGQRLGQRRDLGPQPALRELSQLGGVALAADQGFEHRPAGHTADVAGH